MDVVVPNRAQVTALPANETTRTARLPCLSATVAYNDVSTVGVCGAYGQLTQSSEVANCVKKNIDTASLVRAAPTE